jgi:LDH2 family malate/lactate/ureidoglycolate dehydrogenase
MSRTRPQLASPVRIARDQLERWSASILSAVGVPDKDAAEVSRHLVFADARGISSHGVGRLSTYIARIESGALAASGRPQIVCETAVSALVDGKNALGQIAGRYAVDVAIAKASIAGVAVVGVNESNHSGCLGYYTATLAEAGYLAFACSNGAAFMLPYGGREPYFSSAPISFAAPTLGGPPLLLDMATSEAAFGKIIAASREGRPIPEGWAVTRDGKPTTDSKAALDGYLLPVGGAKGSALALMVEILAGALPNALPSRSIPPVWELSEPQRLGQFFLAIRGNLFGSDLELRQRTGQVLESLREVSPAPGHERVSAPGDPELVIEEETSRNGIPISDALFRELSSLGERHGVALAIDRDSS